MSAEDMRALNSAVDVEHRDVAAVVRAFPGALDCRIVSS